MLSSAAMLTPGSTIGPYRIDREIGRGGMGIIFLAQDTRLGRPAAIKALPEDVAADPERMARFEREAKALASLTHPNVAGIYGLEESEGRKYLALEYVEGESLAERLQRGPLSVADTIELGLQIAAGIEAAHEAGIIHRDLKPANVVITTADQAKVLDFGLAKGKVAEGPSASSPTSPTSPTAHSPTLLHSPTLQTPATMPGVILGTAAYLSPEQARGKVVDRRTDIWSFGCVLWECLTGKLTFDGETVSDTIAKILERDVNWAELPPSTPAALRALMTRCLEKDPRRRLRDIGDARLALEELKAGRSSAALAAAGVTSEGGIAGATQDPAAALAAARATKRRRNLFAAGALLLGAVLSVAVWNALHLGGGRSVGAAGGLAHLSVSIPEAYVSRGFQITDDGKTFLLRAVPRTPPPGQEPIAMIYVRRLEGDKFEPLAGTERVTSFRPYADGKWLLFLKPISERSSDLKMMKAPLDGSAPASELGRWDRSWTGGGAVLESGEVLVSVDRGDEFVRIPAGGGSPSPPRKLELTEVENSVAFVECLPGDRGVLLETTTYAGNVYMQGVAVLDLKSGKAKMLLSDAGSPRYSITGHLLFSRQSTLFAVPFDLGKLEVNGSPVAILEGLQIDAAWTNGSFDVTKSGTLIYAPGGFTGKDRRLVMLDAEGRSTDWSGERLPFEVGAIASPDGSKAASIVATASGIYEIWISERGGSAARRFISREGADCYALAWSPDGSTIAYAQTSRSEEDGIYAISADGTGTPRRLAKFPTDVNFIPTSWTPDGSRVLLTYAKGARIKVLSIAAAGSETTTAAAESLFAGEPGNHANAVLSPDNRLIAYQSDESGQFENYVRAWNGTAAVGEGIPVGKSGPSRIMWSRDGRKLLFMNKAQKFVQVEVLTQPRLAASAPRVLWNERDAKTIGEFMSVLPDGRVLAVRKGDTEDDVNRFDLVLGFSELLKQRLRQAGGK